MSWRNWSYRLCMALHPQRLPDFGHPDLDLLEPQLSFWRGRVEDVLSCHRSLELEYGAAAAAWLAELDHRLGLGGSLQGGHEAPATGWKRLRKRP